MGVGCCGEGFVFYFTCSSKMLTFKLNVFLHIKKQITAVTATEAYADAAVAAAEVVDVTGTFTFDNLGAFTAGSESYKAYSNVSTLTISSAFVTNFPKGTPRVQIGTLSGLPLNISFPLIKFFAADVLIPDTDEDAWPAALDLVSTGTLYFRGNSNVDFNVGEQIRATITWINDAP